MGNIIPQRVGGIFQLCATVTLLDLTSKASTAFVEIRKPPYAIRLFHKAIPAVCHATPTGSFVAGAVLQDERVLGSSVVLIGIGGSLAAPPLPHHRAYGSVHGGSSGNG
jgi:hypothetical protein